MYDQPSSYLSPKIQARPKANGNGNGIFAQQTLNKGELLAVFGGVVYEWDGDYVNHCCNPNAGLSGQIALVAMRDIQPGEEICFDYAMSDTRPYDEFACDCGAPNCRRHVTGSDWQLPELQKRYAGYFAPHVQRKIDAMHASRRPEQYRYAGAAPVAPVRYE